MGKSRDWLPGGQSDIIQFGLSTCNVLNEDVSDGKGGKKKKWELLGMRAETFSGLMTLADEARGAFQRASNPETRTNPSVLACHAAVRALEAGLRDLKRRHDHMPPMTEEMRAELGYPPRARGRVPLGDIDAQVEVRATLKKAGYHQLRAEIFPVSGDLNARNNRGLFFIRYGAFSDGEKVPEAPEELHGYVLTRVINKNITFNYDDSGKTAFFCVRIEDGSRKGEWGPVTRAKIP